jgi:hypothetical protein
VVNDSLKQSSVKSSSQLTSAVNIIQQEWFKASSTKQSNPLDVEDYLDAIEEMSKALLDRVVNLVSMLKNFFSSSSLAKRPSKLDRLSLKSFCDEGREMYSQHLPMDLIS